MGVSQGLSYMCSIIEEVISILCFTDTDMKFMLHIKIYSDT